jgi:hypothetical protein
VLGGSNNNSNLLRKRLAEQLLNFSTIAADNEEEKEPAFMRQVQDTHAYFLGCNMRCNSGFKLLY